MFLRKKPAQFRTFQMKWRHIHTSRCSKSSSKVRDGKKILGIRRETVNAWERRAPLAPYHVKELVGRGVNVLIQPSNRRAYPIQDYIRAGATVEEDLSPASLIMSVKQVPVDDLIPDKTYAFFSHTIKAQKDNMQMLDTILQRKIRLIDYEKMVDGKGQRLVAFGKWAGYAGLINILHGLGLRLLSLGHHTPFLHIAQAHNYRDYHMAVLGLRDAGYEIALNLMPRSLGPLIFVFTGSGNVSQGAQELFQNLPHEYVSVHTLPKVAQHGKLDRLYGCVVSREDHLLRKDGGKFVAEDFEKHPDQYTSKFAHTIAPYASVIVNGIFWAPNSPRLITIPEAKVLLSPQTKLTPDVPGCPTLSHKMIALCDISADPGGSIEFMKDCTTIDKPFCVYDAEQHKITDSFDSQSGVLVCSIDNMPAQMPTEATAYFGEKLIPYVNDMLESDASGAFGDYCASPVVKNAVITSNGRLTPNFEYISDLRNQQQIQSAHKTGRVLDGNERRVLLLGAGFVSGPAVQYLSQDENVCVTVATALQEDAARLNRKEGGVRTVIMDVVGNPKEVEELVKSHDLVISLLPWTLHPVVAKMCIKHKKDMVTTSYLLPQMAELNKAALEAGITVMNEAGLDPGIDHLLAMECIDQIHERGGKVTSFVSFCGGLPTPENSQNPLRYKFNWSPKGVLLALLNPAKFLKDGKVVDIPAGGGVLDVVEPMRFMPGFNLIGYPNRDSTIYAKLYGIEQATTVLRGTLRYKGFTEALRALKEIGLLNSEANSHLNPHSGPDINWKQLVAILMGKKEDIFEGSLRKIVADKFGADSAEFATLDELGLLSEQVAVKRQGTPLDTTVEYLATRLAYNPGERDLVVLRHDVSCRLPNGSEEVHHVDLVNYGKEEGYSAMARCVGYTAGIVSKMILTGEIQQKGMILPMTKEIYRPVLRRLADLGIAARTHTSWKEHS